MIARPTEMFPNIVRSLLLIGALLLTNQAVAFDMGPLSRYIQEDTSGPWSVRNDAGHLVMENPSNPGEIKYFYVGGKRQDEGRRTISVDMSVLDSPPDAMAGLLYGFRQDPKSYFLFTIGGDRSVNLHYFEPGKLTRRMKSQIPNLDLKQVKLTIRENGNEIALLVNDEQVSRLGNDRMGRGAVGVIAANKGAFRFKNFKVNIAQSPRPEPATQDSPDKPILQQPEAKQPAEKTSLPPDDSLLPDGYRYLARQSTDSTMVKSWMPLPKAWSFEQDKTSHVELNGPGEAKVHKANSIKYVHSSDPKKLASARRAGKNVAPVANLEQFLQTAVKPLLEKRRYELVKSYPLPKVRAWWYSFTADGLTQRTKPQFNVLGAEWRTPTGRMSFTTILQSIYYHGQDTKWMVHMTELSAPAESFNASRDAYLFGLRNQIINPTWRAARVAKAAAGNPSAPKLGDVEPTKR